nr:hypothetical protein [Streptomyces cyaneochromogenes]
MSAQACAVAAAHLLYGRREVWEEVPAIGDFQSAGGRLSDGLGEGHQAVTAHDLGAGVLLEPSGNRVGLAVRQDVYGPEGHDVDEDRAVGPPFAERELIDAQYPRCLGRHGRGDQLTQQS